MKWLSKLDRYFEEIWAASLLSVISVLLFLQVIFRYFLNLPLDWTEELARYLFVALVYLSASLGVKYNRHFRVELLRTLLPQSANRIVDLLRNAIWLLFAIVMIKIGCEVAIENMIVDQHSPSLQIKMGYVYFLVPFGYALLSLRIMQRIYRTAARKEQTGGE